MFPVFRQGIAEITVCLGIAGRDPDGLAEAAPFQLAADRLALLALRHEQLAEALGELSLAVSRPGQTPLHAWRAIEACRQHFQDGSARKQAWETMNRTLGVERESYQAAFAEYDIDGPRHGVVRTVPETERIDLLLAARRVVNLYAVYLDASP